MAGHNNAKICNEFFRKNYMFPLLPFQSTHNDTIKSIWQLWIMLKKSSFLLPCIFFHKEYLIRWESSTKYILYVLSFSLYSDTTRWNLRSNTCDFCPSIMWQQIGRCHQSFQYNFIASVQVYEFYGKSEKSKKKALNHHKQENKKSCVGKLTER